MGPVSRRPGRRLRRRLRSGVPAALPIAALAVALLGAQPADAQSVSALQSKVDASRQKAEAMASQIESQTAQLEASRADAVAAAKREGELNATLAQGEERARELSAAVARSQAALERARAKLRRSTHSLAKRLVQIYKYGQTDAIEVLLDSGGFDDLVARADYLQRIQDADSALVTRTRALRAGVSNQLDQVSAARQQQVAHNQELTAARDQIAAVRAQAVARSTALAQARSAQQSELGRLHAQVEHWQAQVQRAQQISAQQAQQQVAGQMTDWAIPSSIVQCESGGNYSAVNPSSGAGGAYQILPSTWKLYGGTGRPQDASPAEQARIAALIWADSGSSAWECAAG